MPAHWYFTSALARALHAAYPLALLAPVADRRMAPVLAVALGFVLLYSGLGHKEVRFLFPVLPLWNLAAAAVVQRLWVGQRTSAASQPSLLLPAGTTILAARLRGSCTA